MILFQGRVPRTDAFYKLPVPGLQFLSKTPVDAMSKYIVNKSEVGTVILMISEWHLEDRILALPSAQSDSTSVHGETDAMGP